MTPTPETDDAFDALKRRACGTEHVRARMEDIERRLTAALSDNAELDRIARAAADCESDTREKLRSIEKRCLMQRELVASQCAELATLRADLERATIRLENVTMERDAGDKVADRLRSELDASLRREGVLREERDEAQSAISDLMPFVLEEYPADFATPHFKVAVETAKAIAERVDAAHVAKQSALGAGSDEGRGE